MGTIHNDFLQLKTTDGVYLKELLESEIFPALALYNERVTTLASLLIYKFPDADPNSKQMFSTDEFGLLADIEQPDNKTGFDSWNRAIPIQRYGAGTKMTLEIIKQMSSKAIMEWHNAKLIADATLLTKMYFNFMILKTPDNMIDELTRIAATPKPFWNDEESMDTPRKNGQITFDGDHQHYLAVAGAASIGTNGADITNLLSLITEHEGMAGQPILWVQKGGTSSLLIQAETTYFRSVNHASGLFVDPNQGYGTSGIIKSLIKGSVTLGQDVDVIGTWKNAVVIETPHMPNGYILATMYTGQNSIKQPLAWREHPAFTGLNLFNENGGNPIIGKNAQYRRYLGLAVYNRDAGAMLYTTGTEWVEPTLS